MTSDRKLSEDQTARMRASLTDALDRDGGLYLTTDAPHDMRALLDEVDRLRARLASFDFEDCVSIGSQQVRIDALEDEAARLRAENTAQAERIAAVAELHRPVNHRGMQACNACTSLDVLMQTMSGRGRRGVEHPCPTRRALGLVQDREGQADA